MDKQALLDYAKRQHAEMTMLRFTFKGLLAASAEEREKMLKSCLKVCEETIEKLERGIASHGG
jgi:hypothetical protein